LQSSVFNVINHSLCRLPTFRVSPVTENAFVWLKIAAPSDLLLDVVRLTNVLTYLLCSFYLLRPKTSDLIFQLSFIPHTPVKTYCKHDIITWTLALVMHLIAVNIIIK